MGDKSYFILLRKRNDGWYVEYGSYDREDVVFELESYRDGCDNVPAKDMKIIKTRDTQEDIDFQINLLNS